MADRESISCSVYGLCAESDMVIRYVGQTTVGIERRLREHIKRAKSANKPVHRDNWIKSVIRGGGEIKIVSLQDNAIWNDSERYWIAKLSVSRKLVNATAGGEGMLGASDELRARISNSVKRLWTNDEYRAKAAGSRKGVPWSEAQKTARYSVPASVRSDRSRRARFSIPDYRRVEIAKVAGLLGWETRREKGTDKGENVNSAKLTDEKVISIRLRRSNGESSIRIAKELGVSVGCICKVVNGLTWSHLDILDAPAIVARGEMSGTATLTECQVMEIRQRALNGERLSEIGAYFGKHRTAIRAIVVGATWNHLPILGYTPNKKHKLSKKVISDIDSERVVAMHKSGMKMTEITAKTGILYHVVRHAIRKAGL